MCEQAHVALTRRGFGRVNQAECRVPARPKEEEQCIVRIAITRLRSTRITAALAGRAKPPAQLEQPQPFEASG